MDKQKIMERLKQAHEQENEFNREIARIDNLIKMKTERKNSLRKKISKNMLYRNKLIKLL